MCCWQRPPCEGQSLTQPSKTDVKLENLQRVMWTGWACTGTKMIRQQWTDNLDKTDNGSEQSGGSVDLRWTDSCHSRQSFRDNALAKTDPQYKQIASQNVVSPEQHSSLGLHDKATLGEENSTEISFKLRCLWGKILPGQRNGVIVGLGLIATGNLNSRKRK